MDEGYPLKNPSTNFLHDGMEGYLRCWDSKKISNRTKFLLEASTHYIFQKNALKCLTSLSPLPVVIVALRNPAQRIYSAFNYTKNNLNNIRKDLTFSQYVKLAKAEDPDAFGDKITGSTAFIFSKQLKRSHYIHYLRPWKESFNENLKIILLEDLATDPFRELDNICSFLGISSTTYQEYDFPVMNKTNRNMLNSCLAFFNKSGLSRADRETMHSLAEEYRQSNRELSEEFGLDLSSWDQII